MTSRKRGLLRNAVSAAVTFVCFGVRDHFPGLGYYFPLRLWCALMAFNYGLSIWLWSREVGQ